MSWITLSADDVKNHVTGAEYTAITTKVLAGSNPVADVLAAVTQEVRGYVAGCERNRLDTTATTIPGELKTAALDITVARLLRRFPGGAFGAAASLEERYKAEDKALTLLRSVARCEFGIEPPTTPADSQAPTSAGSQSVNKPSAHPDFDGLV